MLRIISNVRLIEGKNKKLMDQKQNKTKDTNSMKDKLQLSFAGHLVKGSKLNS